VSRSVGERVETDQLRQRSRHPGELGPPIREPVGLLVPQAPDLGLEPRSRPALARLDDRCPGRCPQADVPITSSSDPALRYFANCVRGLTSMWVATATAAALAWSVLTPAAAAVLRTRSAPTRAKQILRSSSNRPASWSRHAAYSVSLSNASPLAAARARAKNQLRWLWSRNTLSILTSRSVVDPPAGGRREGHRAPRTRSNGAGRSGGWQRTGSPGLKGSTSEPGRWSPLAKNARVASPTPSLGSRYQRGRDPSDVAFGQSAGEPLDRLSGPLEGTRWPYGNSRRLDFVPGDDAPDAASTRSTIIVRPVNGRASQAASVSGGVTSVGWRR
jgi:hypothetical protein